MKLSPGVDGAGNKFFSFWCPGCRGVHSVRVSGQQPVWSFNDNEVCPSFQPSIRVTYSTPEGQRLRLCHSYVTGGMIEFLSDSTHDLAGKTVEIPDWDRRLGERSL